MKPIRPRQLLAAVGTAAGACAIAVPAVLGLSGNPSFSQHIPVGVPSAAHRVSFDSRGAAREIVNHLRSDEPRHHRRHHDDATPTRSAEPGDDRGTHVEPGDDRGTHVEPGDDRGTHVEPGDDRGGATSTAPRSGNGGPGRGTDDNGGTSGGRGGSDDGSRHGGDDRGGRGRH